MKTLTYARVLGLGSMLIFLAGATGCAFGTRQVDLAYPPQGEDGGLLVSAAQAAEPGTGGCCDVVVTVADRRPSTKRIGNVRNGFGMDTADVVTDDDIAAWVADAFQQELADAGYHVLAEAPAGAEVVLLNAEVIEVYCDVYMSYDGEVTLNVSMARGESAPFSRVYEGEGSAGLNWAATGESFGQSLALALREAIAAVMVDLARYSSP